MIGLIAILVIVLLCISILRHHQPQQEGLSQLDKIENLLPQTQCGTCGFDGCRPYAEAIVYHGVEINRCLPGGVTTISRLARTTGKTIKPLYRDPQDMASAQIAVIDAQQCIGCFKCVIACPVDAIVGAPKQIHAIIDTECTGCQKCIAPCPVNCISMQTTTNHATATST